MVTKQTIRRRIEPVPATYTAIYRSHSQRFTLIPRKMNTPIPAPDLTKRPPHSPRVRIAGFAIASRAADKCRASLAGTLGEYHYDSTLDNLLFTFKGVTGGQFQLGRPQLRAMRHNRHRWRVRGGPPIPDLYL